MVKISWTLLPSAVRALSLGAAIGLIGTLGLLPPEERQEQPLGLLLGEHQYAVRCLAFAPDGKTLATGSGFQDVAGEIKLWDVITGTERATLRGNQNGISAVAFAPDGRTLASVDLDKVAKLWDVATSRERASIPLSFSSSVCAVLAPDAQTLALAGWGGDPTSVRLCHVAPEPEQSLAAGSGPVAFSADGGPVVVWRLATELQRTGSGPAEGKRLVLTGTRGDLPALQIREIPLGHQMLTLRGDRNFVWALAFSPDGRTLATGGFDGTVKLWDVGGGRERTTLWGHTDQIDALAFAPDGKLLASASHDSTVRLWDPVMGQELATLRGHTGRVTCVAFAPDGQWVASGSHDRTVRLWPVAKAW